MRLLRTWAFVSVFVFGFSFCMRKGRCKWKVLFFTSSFCLPRYRSVCHTVCRGLSCVHGKDSWDPLRDSVHAGFNYALLRLTFGPSATSYKYMMVQPLITVWCTVCDLLRTEWGRLCSWVVNLRIPVETLASLSADYYGLGAAVPVPVTISLWIGSSIAVNVQFYALLSISKMQLN